MKLTDHQKKYINANALAWIKTLLPNDIDQCQSTLQDDHSYCCLGVGVLCHQIKTGDMYNGAATITSKGTTLFEGGDLTEYPAAQLWLGLHDVAGMFYNITNSIRVEVSRFFHDNGIDSSGVNTYKSAGGSLAGLNDTLGMNFKQIAEFMLAFPEIIFLPISEQVKS